MFDSSTLVVFDLEFTSWEGFLESGWSLPGKHREVVQIGAVKLDVAGGFQQIGTFEALVRPTLHPLLSDYFMDLTGIRQDTVDRDGLSFGEALSAFMDFIGGEDVTVSCHGDDSLVIRENCGWSRVACPEVFSHAVNLASLFAERIDTGGQFIMSGGWPAFLGLSQEYEAHTGLGDAMALAAVLRYLDGEGRL